MSRNFPRAAADGTDEDAPAQPATPGCPAWLSGDARREWNRIAPTLDEDHSPIDEHMLAAYCDQYALMVKTARILARDGPIVRTKSGRMEVHPAARINRQAVSAMRQLSMRLP
jgi:P27 family predicted phage terminase small subunit